MGMRCWSESCHGLVAASDAACPACGSPLRIGALYRITRMLGEGAMGVVYEAVDESLDRPVALKLMHGRVAQDTQRRERFLREGKAMAALDHPGIARIYAASVHFDQLFFVQQLVRGRSLKAAIAASGELFEQHRVALRIGCELLDALAHAHHAGIVHRDVNPNNVMLVDRMGSPHPILIDFGMARTAGQDATKVAWGGTPGYAAPEQILDPTSNDHRSDIYAVGAVLYMLLSAGRVPYDQVITKGIGRNPRAMLKAYQQVATGQVPLESLDELAATLGAARHTQVTVLVSHALEADPKDRFQSAKDMLDALVVLINDEDAQQTTELPDEAAAELPDEAAADQPDETTAELPDEVTTEPETSEAATAPVKTKAGSSGRFGLMVTALLVVLVGGYAALQHLTPRADNPGGTATSSMTPSASAPTSSAPAPQPLPLLFPGGVAVNESGSEIYVADRGNHRIQVLRGGRVSTLAGSSVEGFEGGAAASARFSLPADVGVGPDGAVFVADTMNHRIRVIRKGRVESLAGGFEAADSNGDAATARFNKPEGLAVGADGAVYVADTGNHQLRKILDGKVSTIAGTGRAGSSDGPAAQASFDAPARIALDETDGIYVLDATTRRLRLLRGGKVTTIVTLPPAKLITLEATVARFTTRASVAVGGGRILLSDPNGRRVWQLTGGKLVAYAGSGERGYRDDYLPRAQFGLPEGLAIASNGSIYVSDSDHGTLRKLQAGKTSTPVKYRRGGYAEGLASKARFHRPWAVSVAPSGKLIVADWRNRRVRTIAAGQVDTIAGTGERGAYTGPAANTQFATVWDVAVHTGGNIYVADGGNHRIVLLRDDKSEVFAGNGQSGDANGPAAKASFRFPEGVAVADDQTVYVADTGNHRIRMVSNGVVSTVAGTGEPGLENGQTDSARFNLPGTLAVGPKGVLYIADTGNNCIRTIRQGRTQTLAGAVEPGFADGELGEARFESPIGIAVGADGKVYVADAGNHRIRTIHNGRGETLAGTGLPGFADGPLLDAAFAYPADVEVDATGRVYVADAANHLLRVIKKDSVQILAGAP